MVVLRDNEGVHLHHRAIAGDEKFVEVLKKRGSIFEEGRGDTQHFCELAGLVGLEADEGIDGKVKDFLWGVLGNGFDIHAAFCAGHDDRSGNGAIDEDGEVKFLFDLDRLGDKHFADDTAFLAGLVGHEGFSEHLGCGVANLGGRFAEVHAAFEAVFKSPLAAAASVDLGFNDEVLSVQGSCDFLGFLRC